MKRLLIILAISLIAFSSFAQTTKLAVKGVPIEGTAKEFATKLVAKGCTIDEENKNVLQHLYSISICPFVTAIHLNLLPLT